MNVYKVVHNRQGRLYSMVATGMWEVEYAPSAVTLPPIGTYLLAFKIEVDARVFRVGFLHSEVWRAEATGPAFFVNKVCMQSMMRKPGFVTDFWRKPQGEDWIGFVDAPPGSVACKSLKLLERVA